MTSFVEEPHVIPAMSKLPSEYHAFVSIIPGEGTIKWPVIAIQNWTRQTLVNRQSSAVKYDDAKTEIYSAQTSMNWDSHHQISNLELKVLTEHKLYLSTLFVKVSH